MKFIATQSAKISEMIQINSALTVNEAYVGKNLDLREVVLRSLADEGIQFVNKLYQNEPNPFRGATTIGFDLAQSSDVTLTIVSTTGSVVTSFNIKGKKGYNAYQLNENEIDQNGLYYYKIECEGFSDTKKMIFVR